jgi:hypothetical protein
LASSCEALVTVPLLVLPDCFSASRGRLRCASPGGKRPAAGPPAAASHLASGGLRTPRCAARALVYLRRAGGAAGGLACERARAGGGRRAAPAPRLVRAEGAARGVAAGNAGGGWKGRLLLRPPT